jgi:hypothetical protein
VVALNTDSGRIGLLQPVVTERPQLAAYTAGPGTVGLLSSPVAIAITNPGIVWCSRLAPRSWRRST